MPQAKSGFTFDQAACAALREFQGSKGTNLLVELIGLFEEELPMRLKHLTTAVQNQDKELFQKQTHAFKSSCGQLGLISAADLCKKMENGEYKGWNEAAALLEQLRQECVLAQTVLAQEKF